MNIGKPKSLLIDGPKVEAKPLGEIKNPKSAHPPCLDILSQNDTYWLFLGFRFPDQFLHSARILI